ncbi:MAG: hypothetical protein A2W31_18465 [Planctomycetes bacterium RBG_16_64_10]|nr:MAG: hypothetical protein A2W31_18465 [Planctomycetes bacterium RBG_16_64_10]
MSKVLIVEPTIRIPHGELEFAFVRSSGPGGQNVNKVNSKAILRWQVKSSPSLPEEVRARFLAKFQGRISASGQLCLTSQRYREQQQNLTDCLNKLRAMLVAVARSPRRRRPSRPPRWAVERRLHEKRQKAMKKQTRATPRVADD